jgi:hypothetical protein
MSSISTPATDGHSVRTTINPKRGRWYYPSAAALMLLLMVLGFQQYYLQGKAFPDREIAPPMRTLVLLHGTAMSLWVVLFLVQSLLIANRGYRVHMALGYFGAFLAASIVVLGLWLGILGARVTPPEARVWTLTPKQFLTVPVTSVILFGAYVAVGVYYRRRPEVHKPMMLMATLMAIPAAVSRIGFLSSLYMGTSLEAIFGPFLWSIVLATLLLVAKWVMTRKVERCFMMGYGSLIVLYMLIWNVATTDAWDRFASLLM